MTDATALSETPPSEKRLAAALQHRFFLRVHMAAMLAATLLAGLATTKLLALAGLRIFAIRYGIAVIVAYAVFVGSVKLWLAYIAICAAAARRFTSKGSGDDWFDCLNLGGGGSSSWSSSDTGSSVSEGGGRFGGGGASGSWGGSAPKSGNVMAVAAASQPSKKPSSSSSSSSSKKSSSGGGDSDFGELILVVLIILLVVAVVASFFWMIWAAPTILSEAAFNAVLAGALAKHAHKATHGSWVGSVIHSTRIPFALVLILAVVMGWWAQKYCPDATRLSEAVHCARPAM